MRYKKGETIYKVHSGVVSEEIVEQDFEDFICEPPMITTIFRDRGDAESMAKLINDATDKMLRGNAMVIDAKNE